MGLRGGKITILGGYFHLNPCFLPWWRWDGGRRRRCWPLHCTAWGFHPTAISAHLITKSEVCSTLCTIQSIFSFRNSFCCETLSRSFRIRKLSGEIGRWGFPSSVDLDSLKSAESDWLTTCSAEMVAFPSMFMSAKLLSTLTVSGVGSAKVNVDGPGALGEKLWEEDHP